MRVRFDRGTWLIEGAPPEVEPASLPGVLWDPRVGAYRAAGWQRDALRSALCARLGGAAPGALAANAGLVGSWAAPALRPYQMGAVAAWEQQGRRGLVVLPTGSGKTRVATAAMAAAGVPTLCLVPTRVLLHQWVAELERSLLNPTLQPPAAATARGSPRRPRRVAPLHAGVASLHAGAIGRLGDGTREIAPITVATFESAWRWMERIGHRFEMLVVDEAHHFGCGIRDEALQMCVAPLRLGLTATPPTDAAHLARLEALLGPVACRASIQDLAGQWLASFERVTLPIALRPRERRSYDREMEAFRAVFVPFRRAFPGGTWAEFATAAATTDAGRRAVAGWRRARRLLAYPEGKRVALRSLLERHAGSRVLVFTADNATAYAVAREHLIMPITCDIPRKERDAALARFRSGELRALVSARVLNEGLDVPDAEVGIVVGGAHGEREHVQRVGRVLRPAEGKRALVYELVVRDTSEVRQAARRRRGLGEGRVR
jgi:superfamily II DNA or RNA helicase